MVKNNQLGKRLATKSLIDKRINELSKRDKPKNIIDKLSY